MQSVKSSYDWLIFERKAILILANNLNSSPSYPITTAKVCTYLKNVI